MLSTIFPIDKKFRVGNAAISDSSVTTHSILTKTASRGATIDVWWLSDDGGLTLLVPYLLTQSKSYLEVRLAIMMFVPGLVQRIQGARLRVFTIAAEGTSISTEEERMASLLQKFRIQYTYLHVVAAINQPRKETVDQFYKSLEPYVGDEEGMMSESELTTMQNKTARFIGTGTLLRDYSSKADLVVVWNILAINGTNQDEH
ncbi:hypothetical protein ANCCEY_03711 [Ancylostoma ceylanicum]|uniref:SLC12A transporter C-terminal domain-containing protein n=1 Tax=Ancylostoma ceylanicum TaxID=53326 RepID=A0A0D6LYP0_9BILA|nr:hypothetical protein ANCCEY_03711 [Ancylostoma ceylanicum]